MQARLTGNTVFIAGVGKLDSFQSKPRGQCGRLGLWDNSGRENAWQVWAIRTALELLKFIRADRGEFIKIMSLGKLVVVKAPEDEKKIFLTCSKRNVLTSLAASV